MIVDKGYFHIKRSCETNELEWSSVTLGKVVNDALLGCRCSASCLDVTLVLESLERVTFEMEKYMGILLFGSPMTMHARC